MVPGDIECGSVALVLASHYNLRWMSTWQRNSGGFELPRPGPALKGMMLVLFGVWLLSAISVNWVGVGSSLFDLLTLSVPTLNNGELWRLLTAPLLHNVRSLDVLFTILGLYFLGPSLEAQWGAARMARFLYLSAVLSYAIQWLAALLLPVSFLPRLMPPVWFGALPMVEAVAIAWALTFRKQTVRLFFVLPISSRGLIALVVGMTLMRVVTTQVIQEGLIASFGGMLCGWALGGGTPSPVRKAFLRFKLGQVEREAKRERNARKSRVAKTSLRVIEGGEDKQDGRGPDGKYLN